MFKRAQGNLGSVHSLVSRTVLVGMLSVGAVLSGWVPSLAKDLSIVTGDTAYAQSISNNQVVKYARAVLKMEPIRQSSFREFQRLTGGSVPPDCRRQGLPNNVEYVCKRFFTRSAEILQDSGLSIGEFNKITERLQTDAELKQRIQRELMRQQNN